MDSADRLALERSPSPARLAELGVHAWPVWKDGPGQRTLTLDDAEKSYFLAGRATLTLENGDSVTVNTGDLVAVPAGVCQWTVHEAVRRHYRSSALSPACCII
ncbi:MAG: cupin domain-containing protein [Pseudomonadota bacterium]